MEFEAFPKIKRLSRDIIITEKIDGTNAQVAITDYGDMFVGSRTRWITPEDDNFGFAAWCRDNREELLKLGPGRHFGEWWGRGIQRGYGLTERKFSLFNVSRWAPEQLDFNAEPVEKPACVDVVPLLVRGEFSDNLVDTYVENLREFGSRAAPGFMNPEGVVVFHTAAQTLFKKTLEKDSEPKSLSKEAA